MVIEYALTALVKLSDRYPETAPRIKELILGYNASSHLEIQQRSCEFRRLFNQQKILPQVLEAMPPILSGVAEGEGPRGPRRRRGRGRPGIRPGSGNGGPHGRSAEHGRGWSPGGRGRIGGDLLGDLLGGGPEPAAAARPGSGRRQTP